MMTRDELIIKLAEIFIDGTDSDNSWDAASICETVMTLLREEGGGTLLACCDSCETWYPMTAEYGGCPFYDDHECGDCGNTNSECSCEDCPECGIYYEDCECPRCTVCSNPKHNCGCPEEEAIFA